MKIKSVVVSPLILVFFLMGIISFGVARFAIAADREAITKEDLGRILEKLNELTKRIETLEKDKTGEGTNGAKGNLKNLKADVTEMSERLDKVETKSLTDKISFGAEIRTRFDWFNTKDHEALDPKAHHDRVRALPSNRFRLNLNADVTENMQFNGRLVMYKNWNDMDTPFSQAVNDTNRARITTDTTLKVERAYVNYFFERFPLALTIGRLPFTDGLPTDLREDTPRKSTFPSLAYDIEGDGIALSIGLKDLTTLPSSAFRFVFSRAIDDNDIQIFRDNALEIRDMNIYLAQFETRLPGSLEDVFFIANLIYAPKVISSDFTFLGLTPVELPDSLGSVLKGTFFIESKRFLGSWFDWFAGYSLIRANPKGKPMQYNLASFGLLSDDNRDNHAGYAYHVGLRVNFPFKVLKEPKLGIEYNHGSKYWLGLGLSSEDPLHKIETRGSAWDFYYIQPISKYFSLRAGYTLIDYDYSSSLWFYGAPGRVNQKVANTYFLLDMKF